MNKKEYIEFCKQEKMLPLFYQYWWLNAVCGKNNWDVCIEKQDEKIIGILPYYTTKKSFFTVHKMPPLTQFLGPYLKYPKNISAQKKLSFEKTAISNLIDQIPKYHFFTQQLHSSITNWLPWYWKRFSQTTKYTYILKDLTNLDTVFSSFKESLKRQIKKAKKQVSVYSSEDIQLFYQTNKKSFERQNTTIPYSFEFFQKIDAACKEHQARKIFFAKDEDGNTHAALYLIWDNHSAYYLAGGRDDSFRHSGAMSLLMWEAIKYSGSIAREFNFEGSMIEPIERFFRSFGATQTPYHKVCHYQSKTIQLLHSLKSYVSNK